MQLFGILSLVITFAIATWWLTSGPGGFHPEDESGETEITYQDAINAAKDAVGDVERTNPQPAGRQVEVYKGISMPSNTVHLDLSGKKLSGSLKAEIRLLKDLKTLDLSDNNFTGLPAEVGQLTKLVELDLSNNPITGLPHELGNLKNLRVLDLRGTNFSVYDLEIIRQTLPIMINISTDINI